MIQVIHRALDILEYLAKHKDSRNSLKDISTALDLNAGTCANIIKTLIIRKYIVKDPNRDYLLGPMAFALTGNENYRKDLVDASKPELDSLTEKWKENSLIAILEENMRLVLARSNSTNSIQANTDDHKKAVYTATGRLLLAYLKEEELKKFIHKHGLPSKEEWPEVKSKEKLFIKELEKIKEQGFAFHITLEDIFGLAAPVMRGEEAIAAVGIFMPIYRNKKSSQKQLIKDLKATAEAIAKKL